MFDLFLVNNCKVAFDCLVRSSRDFLASLPDPTLIIPAFHFVPENPRACNLGRNPLPVGLGRIPLGATAPLGGQAFPSPCARPTYGQDGTSTPTRVVPLPCESRKQQHQSDASSFVAAVAQSLRPTELAGKTRRARHLYILLLRRRPGRQTIVARLGTQRALGLSGAYPNCWRRRVARDGRAPRYGCVPQFPR